MDLPVTDRNRLTNLLEMLMFYYITTPYPELKNIFQMTAGLLYKYLQFGEIDPHLYKNLLDFIEMKKREPIRGLKE